jgi:DNA adenine methylase
LSYDGGKGGSGVYQRIINQMPPHSLYVEPFLGMGAVMKVKAPARISLGIDIDPAVIAQWTGKEVPELQLLNVNGIEYLETESIREWNTRSLIYCDPPYLLSTRRRQRPIYRYELSEQQHEDLLLLLLKLNCLVMISGYWSELYADHLRGWRKINFEAMTRGGKTATEYLWMNFAEPSELHDYRYLGEGFRERERIKRKKQRWVNRLSSMPQLERLALSAALAEVGDVRSGSSIAETNDAAR